MINLSIAKSHVPQFLRIFSAPTGTNNKNLGIFWVLGWVLQRLSAYPKLVAATLLMLTLQEAFKVALAFSLKFIVDDILPTRDFNLFGLLLLVLLTGFIFSSLAGLAGDYLVAKLTTYFVNDVQMSLFEHLQTQSSEFYTERVTGDLLSSFTADLNAIDKVIDRLVDAIASLITIVLTIAMMIFLEWRLALAMMVVVPLLTLGSRIFAVRATEASARLQASKASVLAALQENVMAHMIVCAFGLQRAMRKQMQQRFAEQADSNIRADFLSQLIGTTSGLSIMLVRLLVIAIGGWLMLRGWLTSGGLLAFLSLLATAGDHGTKLAKKAVPAILKSVGAIKRIRDLMDKRPNVVNQVGAIKLPRFSEEIWFDEVYFGYPHRDYVLKNIDLVIPAGQTVAFVGESGTGKSTIIKLIERFYDVSSGQITIDGFDVRSVTLESLRQQIGIVFQEPFLFNTTLRENIRMGKLNATDQEIEQAARAAEVHQAICSFPKGYDTLAGEMGAQLSGGQRQRIALARAILRNPSILILDEATSALDVATEAAILDTLSRLKQNRTIIWVTHRLSSVQHADCIFMMHKGRIVEKGCHDALMRQGGRYYALWQKFASAAK